VGAMSISVQLCTGMVRLEPFPRIYFPHHCPDALGTPYQAHISSAKAAIDALSAVLAVEEGPRGVRSNVLAPGPIGETEGMERLKNNKFNLEDAAKTYVPLQRMGQRQDVANMGVFLFSEAALWITGHVFVRSLLLLRTCDSRWMHR